MAAVEERLVAGGEAFSASSPVLRDGIVAGEVGVWRWDAETDRLICSANIAAIHRVPEDSFDGTFEGLLRYVHADDRGRLRQSVRDAISKGDRYAVQYRLQPGPLNSTRWIEARGQVFRDSFGRPAGISGVSQDITAYKEAEEELRLRARQQEAVAQLGERALAGVELSEIFTEAARTVSELVEAEMAEILELTPDREALVHRAGEGWSDEPVGRSVASSDADTQFGLTLRSKLPVVVTDFATEDRFARPERLAAHGVQSAASVTIAGSEGHPFGILAVYCTRVRCISSTDVRFLQSVANVLGSAIRAAQDHARQQLLIGELRHRVGNLFSLVQALHRQTGLSAQDARDLELKFGARLAALASAHAMILDGGWQKTSLRGLLQTTLAPYIERVTFTGTDVRLPADAAFSFSMALHELATNATKYGALSNGEGRLEIDCSSVPDALGEKLRLVWNEVDGPPPAASKTDGFGSKLIAQIVERQLGGSVQRVVEPNGLRFTIEFPVG